MGTALQEAEAKVEPSNVNVGAKEAGCSPPAVSSSASSADSMARMMSRRRRSPSSC